MINDQCRRGLRIKCNDIDKDLHTSILEFAKWLRKQANFPIRFVVYVKKEKQIKNMYGELAYGTFFAPFDTNVEPYARVATGEFNELRQKWGRDDAVASILHTLAHEIAHYEQWVKNKELNCRASRSRATRLINKYAETREHP